MPQGAIDKELDALAQPYKVMIEASPFVVLATRAGVGIVCSPRGRAQVFRDDALGQHYQKNGKAPATFIRIAISNVQFQCGRAVMRSALWSASGAPTAATAGQMMTAAKAGFDGDGYDAALHDRQKKTLY